MARVLLCAAVIVAAAFGWAPLAHAVTIASGPTTTVAPNTESTPGAQYTFAAYRTGNYEQCTGCRITFPAGTNVAGATAVSPAGAVAVAGQTVTITFTARVPAATTFNVVIGGITNPPAGTYNVGNITFNSLLFGFIPYTTNRATGNYTIASGYLTLTIETPDAGQAVDFGSVDPGVTTAAKSVLVTVDSGAAYTISRTVAGDAAALGLTVSGDAEGAKPAGTSTYTDDLTLAPPWTTDPDTPLMATVTYTVTQ